MRHALFALLAFFAGAAAAIVSITIVRGPFGYFGVLLGVVSLVTLILYYALGDSSPMAGLGLGGVERWVAYPVVLWIAGPGGHLLGRAR